MYKISPEMTDMMMAEWRSNSNWSRQKIQDLAKQIGISYRSVYKWNWDQKKRFEEYEQAFETVRFKVLKPGDLEYDRKFDFKIKALEGQAK